MAKTKMYDFKDWWGEDIDGRSDDTVGFGIGISVFRAIFDLALLSIVAVFLVQHDKHEYALATILAKCIAAITTTSFILNLIWLCFWVDPLEDAPIPVILHFLLASGRFTIVVLGLVPKNVLRHIWVQYSRDENGGVIIALLAVLWVTDVMYCLLGLNVLWRLLIFPCWVPWKLCIDAPLSRIRERAKGNREIEDKETKSRNRRSLGV